MNRVVVIGGGPSGSVAASFLAQQGAEVTLVERDQFPRHHVGESLQPSSLQMLDVHFNLGAELRSAQFARKYGAVYIWGERKEPWGVLFDPRLTYETLPESESDLLSGDYLYAWQVDRAKFDTILLNRARALGVTVLQNTSVTESTWSQDSIQSIRLESKNKAPVDLDIDWLIDASGQRCWTGRKMGTIQNHPDLQSIATYAYFDHCSGLPNSLARHAQYIVTIPEGWVWFIPNSATRTSIGWVSKSALVPNEQEFLARIRSALAPIDIGDWAEPQGQRLRIVRDWSYTNQHPTGLNWITTGDALGFVDPILSGGVDFAIRSGINGAMAIHLSQNGVTDAIKDYGKQAQGELDAYLRMARYWYGNNRSQEGFFWEAMKSIPKGATSTSLRAFVYLTSGQYATDQHFEVFDQWQERHMFRALGVNKEALKAALKRNR